LTKKKEGSMMCIPSHSGITKNERADEAAKNALEQDINDRELYPPKDLINWMEKTNAKNRHERYRVEGRLNQPKQKGASGGIQTKDGVHTRKT
jgi:hypothetical protein